MAGASNTVLKEARQLLKECDYLGAMKKCKTILKKEKDNYIALVLLSAAMQEIEDFKQQVPVALQKAIDVQPDNPLAWQGLISYYKKEPETKENQEKLVLAYLKLLQLKRDCPNFVNNLLKLSELSLRIKDQTVLNEIIQVLSTLRDSDNEDHKKYINKILAGILVDCINLDDYQDLYESVLASVILDNDVVNRQDYYRQYLKVLYSKQNILHLAKEAKQMHQQFPQDAYPLECVCHIYYKGSILEKNYNEIDITEFCDPLLKLNSHSEAGVLAKAVHFTNIKNLTNARDILVELIALKPRTFYAWILLSEIYLKLYCWDDAQNAARQALELARSQAGKEVLSKIELTLLESMSRSSDEHKQKTALKMCENFLEKTPASIPMQLIHARINVLLDDPTALLELTRLELHTKRHADILRALYLKNHKHFEEATNILGSVLETSESWLLLGQIYWEMAEYNQSLMAFLNAVKADRHNWEAFVFLGRYYSEYSNDIERARRCYQTALQLNPNSELAGIGLSTAYRLQKNHDANVQLLQKLTMQDGGPKWAWLQLGLQHLDKGDATQAIKAIQHVIRADPNDNHSWESLGDAYLKRGAYTSALKSYQRALELSPDSFYPMIQIANIKLAIRRYDEAKEDFKQLLLTQTNHIPALKGLAEACLNLGKENIARHFLGRARENFQQAVDSLTSIILQRNDLSCVWKLLGDTFYRTATLPERYNNLNVVPALIRSDSKEDRVIIQPKDLCLLSARSYCCALSISKDSALLWYDLARCYLMQLQQNSTADKDLINKCLTAAKHAVKLCPGSWSHWNLLGVICMSPYIKNYALAQHSYIMAIDQEPNNAVVWTNLATLYLHLGKLRKANEAYSQAQRSDPSYVNCWVGQGLIAEMVGSKEVMDLFRHSTQLGYHSEAAVGYAHFVLLPSTDIEKYRSYKYAIEDTHAMSVAADVLNWYTEHHPNNLYARNAYGLILERQKLYMSAAEQYSAALEISEGEKPDALYINLARIFIKLEEYRKSIKLSHSVKTVTFNSQCHLALSFFKVQLYRESYCAYKTALEGLADTSLQRAHTLCAMAHMAYILGEIFDVKTLLFQCIQIQPPPMIGLLAAASLGILDDDLNLTTLVLNELKPAQNDPEYRYDVVKLFAYFHLIQGEIREAVVIISKAIHKYPYDVRFWVQLLRILLETDLCKFEVPAKKALILSRRTVDTNFVYVACASIFSYITQGSFTQSIRSAQKLAFAYPGHIESWATLIATFLRGYADSNFQSNAQWLASLISMVHRSRYFGKKCSRPIELWLSKNQNRLESEVVNNRDG